MTFLILADVAMGRPDEKALTENQQQQHPELFSHLGGKPFTATGNWMQLWPPCKLWSFSASFCHKTILCRWVEIKAYIALLTPSPHAEPITRSIAAITCSPIWLVLGEWGLSVELFPQIKHFWRCLTFLSSATHDLFSLLGYKLASCNACSLSFLSV